MNRAAPRLAVVLLLFPASALAHDCWLAPARDRVAPGESVEVRRLTGHDFEGQPWALTRETTGSFVHHAAAGAVDLVPGIAWVGTVEAVTLPSLAPGTHVVVFQVAPRRIELKAERFAELLEEEGLARPAPAQGGTVQVLFRRTLKTIFQVGATADETWSADCGAPFDLWPVRSPAGLKAGERLSVRLLLRGQPVEGAVISARSQRLGRHHPVQSVATGPDGTAELELKAAGTWMFTASRAVPAPAGSDADHELHFATLTLSVP